MNGPQDMGGMQGFGPVRPEADEPPFHAEWERRVLALNVLMGASGMWNLDMSRSERETIPPARYLASTYYEIWLEGLEKLLVKTRLATVQEIAEGRMRESPAQKLPRFSAEEIVQRLAKGASTRREVASEPRFHVGDVVSARQMSPQGHTRLPRYCRGKRGTVVLTHGAHVFADTHAAGQGEQPQWLYTVRFDARELWGPDTTASSVNVDCWEPYLENEA